MKQPQLIYYSMGGGAVAFSTTRKEGYSQGAYGQFNINGYCGDDAQAIARNRETLCRLLGIDVDRLLLPHQTHQTAIACIGHNFLTLTEPERQAALEGKDALTTSVPGVCIGVSTADCIPVLLYDREHRAASAIHAGWRGTVQRIVEKAVQNMVTIYGTRPAALTAQIGPGISLDCFEVGQEVYDAFSEAGFDMETISCRYPVAGATTAGEWKWHIDLPECNRQQLLAAGLQPQHIGLSPACTFSHPDWLFSARRLGIQSGRIFTGIMLYAG